MKRTLGVVLAGGQSRRFGSDKVLAVLDGRPLIEDALAAPGGCDALAMHLRWLGATGWAQLAERNQPARPAGAQC